MSRRPVRGAARLAAILDALPDALLLVDGAGTVVNANAMALEAFETPAMPLVGQPLASVLPDFAARTRADGPGAVAISEGRTKPTRLSARRTDGRTFPVEVTSASLPGETYDRDLRMLVVRNLTDALDVESELHRQQRQTELILRAATEGIVGVDTNGRIVLVNPAAARILRCRASDLGGQDVTELLRRDRKAVAGPADRDDGPILDTLSTGRKHRLRDVVLWRRDGVPVFVEMSTAPVLEGDQLVGAVMTFTDTSEFKAVWKRNEELVTVLDGELRRPLNAIYREVAQLCEDGVGELGPQARRVLRHVVREFERVTQLTDDVLDYHRFETGKVPLDRRTCDMDKIIQFAVDANANLARHHDVDFAVHAAPVRVVADQERLIQAVRHLIADAITASEPGSTVVIAAGRREGVARIEVRGPAGGGSALHLPIARGIVERHGGSVESHDLPGRGTTYVVELPLEPGDVAGERRIASSWRERALGPDPQAARSGRRAALSGGEAANALPAEPMPNTPATRGGGRRRGRPAEGGEELPHALPAPAADGGQPVADDQSGRSAHPPQPAHPAQRDAAHLAPGMPVAHANGKRSRAHDARTQRMAHASPAIPSQARSVESRELDREHGGADPVGPALGTALSDPQRPGVHRPGEVAPDARPPGPSGRHKLPSADQDEADRAPSAFPVPVTPAYQRKDTARQVLVWPEPDTETARVFAGRGYLPVLVRAGNQIREHAAAEPAALFVDPVTGPITRTALRDLRAAAVQTQLPVLVTAGLGEATRDAVYGADPAVLLRALTPELRDPPRVLLVEENQDVATAFAATLQRRAMQVLHAPSEAEAVTRAVGMQPDAVVIDLALLRRRRVGIVDWLRNNGRLASTPIVVYTQLAGVAADPARLRAGETVLFFAERSTRDEVQQRLADLLGKLSPPRHGW